MSKLTIGHMDRMHLRTLLTLFGVLPALLAIEVFTQPSPAEAVVWPAAAQNALVVASANVREGTRRPYPRDVRHPDDRRRFAARLLSRGTRVPDVVLLQEALGSDRAVAAALNAHPRAARFKARYAVAVPARMRPGTGSCDGSRPTHRLVRDGAILVNTRTIARVLDRGAVRTWGEWAWSADCVEQTWVRVSVRNGRPGYRQARIANIHTAPFNQVLKERAIVRTVDHLRALNRRTPRAMLVVGGDFNLARCVAVVVNQPEYPGCAVRAAHRHLEQAGFRDAIRHRNNVAGERARIDFIYSQRPITTSWWDRCYLAYNTGRPCAPGTTQFGSRSVLAACQTRHDFYGRPGGGCSSVQYRRYYSDHPILLATLRWR